jgi:hypothetical protein
MEKKVIVIAGLDKLLTVVTLGALLLIAKECVYEYKKWKKERN